MLLAIAALVIPTATAAASGGGTEFFAHVFPVDGPHGTRGPIGEFGAPRSGGRSHEGFDVVAACDTPLVAVVTGRVLRSGYDPVLYGNYLLIHGQGERRSYFYAHLVRPAAVQGGDRVWAGERVGAVGETGNASTVGCHLHFEIHVHGHPIDPEPELDRWDHNEAHVSKVIVCAAGMPHGARRGADGAEPMKSSPSRGEGEASRRPSAKPSSP